MSVTQYIGARYVPIFADPIEWSPTKTYEPLTIVMHQGDSFTSKQFVPLGVDINNTNFWALTGNYNAQVVQYRQEVLNFADSIVDRAFAFDNVAKMQACDALYVGAVCHTNGFHASGDGGAAYYIVSASGTANGRDVLTLRNGLYATLVITEPYVTPEQFGAYGNGTNDDTSAIQAALDKFGKVKGSATYKITEIDVTGCSLELDNVGVCSIVSDGDQAKPCEVSVKYADTLTLGTFKNSTFNLGFIKTLNVSPANSFGYNKLYYGRCNNLNIGVSQQSYWVNENQFYGRVSNGIAFKGTYPHNCNYFYCSSEGSNFAITSEGDIHDNIFNLYGEGIRSQNLTFSGYNNIIQQRYTSYKNSNRNSYLSADIAGGTISKPTSNDLLKFICESHIQNLNQNTGLSIANYSEYENFLITVAENETVYIFFDADKAAFRNALYAYDANMQPVDVSNVFDNVADEVANSIRLSTDITNKISFTASASISRISIPYKPEVKYWRFSIYKYTGGPFYNINTRFYSTGGRSLVSKLDTVVS